MAEVTRRDYIARRAREERIQCPHCGKSLGDKPAKKHRQHITKRDVAASGTKAQRDDLLAAIQAASAKPDGYCLCANQEQIRNGHAQECRDVQAAIARATGAAS